jgi:hypothetical protein
MVSGFSPGPTAARLQGELDRQNRSRRHGGFFRIAPAALAVEVRLRRMSILGVNWSIPKKSKAGEKTRIVKEILAILAGLARNSMWKKLHRHFGWCLKQRVAIALVRCAIPPQR